MSICKVDGCERIARANDYCGKHYRNWHRCGDPLGLQRRSVRGVAAAKHPLYSIWAGMRQRCRNPKVYGYKNYGGRGITICDRWDDFWIFTSDMGERPSAHHSIDRIDPDGNYEPGNCRWATPSEQSWNRRVARLQPSDLGRIMELIAKGKSKLAISRELGLDYSAVLNFAKGSTYQVDGHDHATEAPAKAPNAAEMAYPPRGHSVCSMDNCAREIMTDGLCRKHWRWANESKTLAGVADPLGDRHCENCGTLINHRRVDARFCDVSCKMQHHRAEGCYAPENRPEDERKCSVDGCDRTHQAHGMCRAHYMRKWHAENDRKKESA